MAMLIFLYGQDTYRLSKKLEEIIGEYKKRRSGLDFLVIDAISEDTKNFFSALNQISLFGEKKFVVLKNPIANKEFKEEILGKMGWMTKLEHNVVFYQEGKVLKKDRLLAALSKQAQVVEFEPLTEEKLIKWVTGEFVKIGNQVDQLAATTLIQRVGNDLWYLANEINKIGHYFFEERITVANIESFSVIENEVNIFKTIDAIAQRDKRTALALLRDHINRGDHPLYLLAMMATQFRNLLLVKSCISQGRPTTGLGIHPYVLGKAAALVKRFGQEELKKIYLLIGTTDYGIKSGRIDPEAGMDILVASI